jgi:hypothetical protein
MKRLISNALIVAIFISSALFYKHALKLQQQTQTDREVAAAPLHAPLHTNEAVQDSQTQRAPASALSEPSLSILTESPRAQMVQEPVNLETYREEVPKKILNRQKISNLREGEDVVGFGNVVVMTNQKSNYIHTLSSEGPTFGFKLGTENELETHPPGIYEIQR